MKRLGVITFAFFYLLFSIGFAVNVHYCCGKIDSVSLTTINSSCCCSESNMAGACCNDDVYVLAMSEEQQPAVAPTLDNTENSVIPPPVMPVKKLLYAPDAEVVERPDHPPPRGKDIRIAYRALTIYG